MQMMEERKNCARWWWQPRGKTQASLSSDLLPLVSNILSERDTLLEVLMQPWPFLHDADNLIKSIKRCHKLFGPTKQLH
eukprot:6044459-Amphidinium_carterae.1